MSFDKYLFIQITDISFLLSSGIFFSVSLQSKLVISILLQHHPEQKMNRSHNCYCDFGDGVRCSCVHLGQK